MAEWHGGETAGRPAVRVTEWLDGRVRYESAEADCQVPRHTVEIDQERNCCKELYLTGSLDHVAHAGNFEAQQ